MPSRARLVGANVTAPWVMVMLMSFPYASRPAKRLRPEAPKSPWSRRIGFSAPSGHFRIVLFLIGFFAWFLGLLIDGRFFFVLCSASVSYGFVLRVFIGGFCIPSVFDGWFSFRLRSFVAVVPFE